MNGAAKPDSARLPWAWILSWTAVGVVIACWIALVPLSGIAHIQDEIVYQFQARLLSEGRLWEPARLPRAAYVYDFISNQAPTAAYPLGRRFGIFPNGWPLLLAPGVRLGLPWLINPLLHGGLVAVGAILAARTAGRRAAWIAAPLLAISPGLLLLASSRMSHPLCVLLATGAVLLLSLGPSRRRAVGLGALLGLLLLTRPIDALVIGGLLGVIAILKGQVRAWILAVPGVALAVALTLAQNHLLSGHALVFPQDAWFSAGEPAFPSPLARFVAGCNDLGFGPDHGCSPTFGTLGHTPAKAIIGATHNAGLAARLWVGSPLLLLFALAAPRRLLALAAASWTILAASYGLYWYSGPCLGGRFHHAAAGLVIIAVAAGLARLSRRLGLPATAALLVLPVCAWRLSLALPELPDYWGLDDRLDKLEASWTGGPALFYVAYGPPWSHRAQLLSTVGAPLTYSALLRRGMWIERRDGPLAFAEYQPALVDATAAAWPLRPRYLLILTGSASTDVLRALPDPQVPQLKDLPLPAEPVGLDPASLTPTKRDLLPY